jgi:hypothetical protein
MKTASVLLSFAATTLVSAAPSAQLTAWSPALAGYYQKVALHIQEAKESASPSVCDLAGAAPPIAPTPLPAPDGLTLAHVALGRGIQVNTPRTTPAPHQTKLTNPLQNYTCASNSADVKPVAIGALAHLYNASCLASAYPDLLSLLPDLALQYPLPNPGIKGADSDNAATLLSSYTNAPPADVALSGHHFFDAKTPVFELNSNPSGPDTHLGLIQCKANKNSTAPAGSCPGVGWQGDGAVAWLFLNTTDASETTDVLFDGVNPAAATAEQPETWRHVYRVNTAGGAPPKNCAGIEPEQVISVQYAANYWYYKGV